MKTPKLATHINTLCNSYYRVIEWYTNTEVFLWGDNKWIPVDENFHCELLPQLTEL